jgi:hypothetical protein
VETPGLGIIGALRVELDDARARTHVTWRARVT